jgi:cardiolipin synthase A/B
MPDQPIIQPQAAKIDGHELRFVQHGPDRLALILETIASANISLRLYYYIFDDDKTGRVLSTALISARERGVAVTLLIDGFGSQESDDSFFAPMVAAGVLFNRFIPRLGRRFLLRNHQKMLIADERVAIVGGFNIDTAYFKTTKNGQHWHDFALRVEGEAVSRLAAYFDALAKWMGGDKPKLRELTQILTRFSDKSGTIRWVMGGPFRRLSPYVRQLKLDLERAKQVDMIQAYFAPNPAFLRKLSGAARRGSMRLISAARSDNVTTIAAARHCFRRLMRAGSDIHEFTAAKLHGKLIVADNVVYLGSANFDMRSLYLNSEIMVRIDDSGFAEAMRSAVAQHLPHCEAVTPASLKAGMGLFSGLWRRLSYYIVASVDFRLTRNLNWRR